MDLLNLLKMQKAWDRFLRRERRITKRARNARAYYLNGLNGPRAVARRLKQIVKLA